MSYMCCACVCFGGADLTSTSYVYSSLVGDRPGRVVAGAAVHPAVADLRLGDVQVADDVSLRRDAVAHPVTAVLHYQVIVQRPGDEGLRRPVNVTHQGHKLIRPEKGHSANISHCAPISLGDAWRFLIEACVL